MKKMLFTGLAILSAMLLSYSSAHAQSLYITSGEFKGTNGVEIPNGSSIFVYRTTSLTSLHSGVNLSNPWLLGAGSDTLAIMSGDMNQTDGGGNLAGWVNPLPYLAGGAMGYGSVDFGIDMDSTGLTEAQPNMYIYLRIFANLPGMAHTDFDPSFSSVGMGFSQSGMWNGKTVEKNMVIAPNPADGGNPWFGFYYYDITLANGNNFTLTYSPTIPKITGIDLTGQDVMVTEGFLPMFAVPEPSVMFLMAGGLCWLIRRVKRS